MAHGTFTWNELMTPDIEAAKAFYARVAGWTFQDVPYEGGTYVVASVPGNPVPVAGLMAWPAGQPGGNDWFAYISVDDIDAAVAEAKAAGGTVLREKSHVGGTGWFAIVIDSAGTAIGFLEPEPM
jgi:uncharacterized protein